MIVLKAMQMEYRNSDKSQRNGSIVLTLLAFFLIFQINAFVESSDIMLSMIALTIVGTVSIVLRQSHILSWRALVPIYCLFMYGVIPTVLYGFGLNDTYMFIDGIPEALLLVCGFVLVFSFTYDWLSRTLKNIFGAREYSVVNGRPFIELGKSFSVYPLGALTGYALWYSYTEGYFGLHSADTAGAFAGIASTGQLLLSIWICYASVGFWDSRTRRSFVISLAISFGLVFLSGLLSNSKGAIVVPLIVLGLARFVVTGRVPIAFFVSTFVVLVLVAFPVVSGFRAAALGRSQDLLGDVIALQGVFLDEAFNYGSLAQTAANLDRSLLIVLAGAVSSIGAGMDFLNGDTYTHALATFVPRVLWPEKPDMDIGNLIGHQFGFLDTGDVITSVSPGFIGECYVNFGTAGCFLGAICLAFFSVILDQFIVGGSRYGRVFFAVNILWLEGAVGHTFFPFVKGIALVLITLFVFYGLRRFFSVSVDREETEVARLARLS